MLLAKTVFSHCQGILDFWPSRKILEITEISFTFFLRVCTYTHHICSYFSSALIKQTLGISHHRQQWLEPVLFLSIIDVIRP